MLGNGLCTRPVELDCRMESACETCAYFRTSTSSSCPTLTRQRDHATEHGQTERAALFEKIIGRHSMTRPLDTITRITPNMSLAIRPIDWLKPSIWVWCADDVSELAVFRGDPNEIWINETGSSVAPNFWVEGKAPRWNGPYPSPTGGSRS